MHRIGWEEQIRGQLDAGIWRQSTDPHRWRYGGMPTVESGGCGIGMMHSRVVTVGGS
mgnify:CR=1 FL=1